jgi:hypothetical protein
MLLTISSYLTDYELQDIDLITCQYCTANGSWPQGLPIPTLRLHPARFDPFDGCSRLRSHGSISLLLWVCGGAMLPVPNLRQVVATISRPGRMTGDSGIRDLAVHEGPTSAMTLLAHPSWSAPRIL